MKLIVYIFTIIFIINFSVSALAIETYQCKYPTYSDKEGNHKDNNFNLTFTFDKNTGKAYIIGNNGNAEVIYINKKMGKAFIEITDSGSVMTTTINKKMNSVHSRNSIMFTGDLIPSQYYGSCIKKTLNH